MFDGTLDSTTMKLLILTCLMAAALAMPKLHHRNAVNIQNQQQYSSEEQQESVKLPMYLKFNEKFFNDLNKQRAVLAGEQSDEIKQTMNESTEEQAMTSVQQAVSSTSSSSEETENVISNLNEEQLKRQIKCNQQCQQATMAQQTTLSQQSSLAQQASLAQQSSLAQQVSLAQQTSMAQQAALAQLASLAQQSAFAQKLLPRPSQFYYSNMEQPYRMSAYNQVQMQRQPMSVVEQELAQFFTQVVPQFYQHYETYPFWSFIPQDVQHITPESVLNSAKPIAPKTAEETKVW
uniref:alpha-S1-casein isoform X6 n=1 Tax=Myodes glareolus TaxID=447135 RepID=UPI002022854C|nr:alpha-S1-casein isoform X6 [Myodes glareolus]